MAEDFAGRARNDLQHSIIAGPLCLSGVGAVSCMPGIWQWLALRIESDAVNAFSAQ